MTNSKSLLPHTGEGIVIDIGTGDGRFVSAAARREPNKFFIGIDANAKGLEKPSMKATRKPSKGGLPNALFVMAAVEELPGEFEGVADEVHIHFPWGSLLRSVASGDLSTLSPLRRICAPGCILEVIIGIDPDRDRAEIERLGIPRLTQSYLTASLIPSYRQAGFELVESRMLAASEWEQIETSWARRLKGSTDRKVTYLVFRAS